MKIVATFAVVQECFYSVLYDTELNAVDDNGVTIPPELLHEFRRLFEAGMIPKD